MDSNQLLKIIRAHRLFFFLSVRFNGKFYKKDFAFHLFNSGIDVISVCSSCYGPINQFCILFTAFVRCNSINLYCLSFSPLKKQSKLKKNKKFLFIRSKCIFSHWSIDQHFYFMVFIFVFPLFSIVNFE